MNADIPVAVYVVGQALLLQLLNHGDHLVDVFRGGRIVFGTFDAQGVQVVEKCISVTRGVLAQRDTLGGLFADDLVVDVRQIHDLCHLQSLELQVATQEVFEQERPEVADMHKIVNGGAAGVHSHMTGLGRCELLLAAGQCIVELQRHDPSGLTFSV